MKKLNLCSLMMRLCGLCLTYSASAEIVSYVYVTNAAESSISMYKMESTGSLTPLQPPKVAAGSVPVTITVTPNNSYAYVTNQNSDSISMYKVEESGVLAPLSPATIAVESHPAQVIVSSDGLYAYVSNNVTNKVSMFSIESTTGILKVPPSTIAAGTKPNGLLLSRDGKYAYAANNGGNNISMYKVNAATGVLSANGSSVASGTAPNALVTTPGGLFAYASNGKSASISMYKIETGGKSAGQLKALNPSTVAVTGTTPLPSGAAVHPNGKFYYVTDESGNKINKFSVALDGKLTAINTILTGSSPTAIMIESIGKFAYVTNFNSNSVSVYSVESVTGDMVALGSSIITGAGPRGIAVASKMVGADYICPTINGTYTESSIVTGADGTLWGVNLLESTFTVTVSNPAWLASDVWQDSVPSSQFELICMTNTTGTATSSLNIALYALVGQWGNCTANNISGGVATFTCKL